MYNSKYYTCEQIDQRLLQGYYDDAVTAGYTGSKAQYLAGLLKAINYSANPDNLITANKVVYNPAISGLTSKNVQEALDEIESKKADKETVNLALDNKFDKISVTQKFGDSEELVISQKAVSDGFKNLSSTISQINEKANTASTAAGSATKMAEDNKSALNTVTSDISTLKKKVEDIPATIPKLVNMTEAAYEALETKEADTYYMLTEA